MTTRVDIFMTWFTALLLSGLIPTSAIAAANNLKPDLQYRASVVKTDAGSEWHVSLKMKGNADGVTILEVPSKWASRDGLEKGIQDFRVSGSDVVVEDDAGADAQVRMRRIRHQPHTEITVTYRLTRIGSVEPQSQNDAYSPLLHSQYFHVIGTGAWVTPSEKHGQLVNININWTLPTDWAIANSFGVNQITQSLRTTLQAFRHALYLGGDFRIASFKLRDQPVYVALRGDWDSLTKT